MDPTLQKTFKPGIKETRSYSFERAATNKAARTAELSFSSETPYERVWGREILDHGKKSVRLDRLRAGGPLLVDHDTRDIVGVIESARIDSDLTGRAVVRFGKNVRAEEVFQDVQEGIRRNVSVAYQIHDAVAVETKDGVPTYRITDWEPLEISLVSVPADASVGVGRSMDDPKPNTQENQKMQDVQLRAERARANEILIIGRDFGGADLATQAVQDGISVQEFQSRVLESRKSKPINFGHGLRTTDNMQGDPKLGFKNYGHFCNDVVQACKRNGSVSETLSRAASV